MILFITGYSGSGKDTIGEYMVKEYKFKRYAFADILKEEFSVKEGIDLSILHDRQTKEEFRARLIEYAKSWRNKDPYHWTKLLYEKMKLEDSDIVITDWRHQNEIEYFKIKNPSIFTIRVLKNTSVCNYTDDFLDSYETDIILENNDGVVDMYKKIDIEIKRLKNKNNN